MDRLLKLGSAIINAYHISYARLQTLSQMNLQLMSSLWPTQDLDGAREMKGVKPCGYMTSRNLLL